MNTTSVLYKLTCKKPQCSDWVYIGQTGRKFKDRLAEHRQSIHKKDLTKPAGHHFNQRGHSIEDLQAIAFEKVLPVDRMLREQRESMWISRHQSRIFGGNSRE